MGIDRIPHRTEVMGFMTITVGSSLRTFWEGLLSRIRDLKRRTDRILYLMRISSGIREPAESCRGHSIYLNSTRNRERGFYD